MVGFLLQLTYHRPQRFPDGQLAHEGFRRILRGSVAGQVPQRQVVHIVGQMAHRLLCLFVVEVVGHGTKNIADEEQFQWLVANAVIAITDFVEP